MHRTALFPKDCGNLNAAMRERHLIKSIQDGCSQASTVNVDTTDLGAYLVGFRQHAYISNKPNSTLPSHCKLFFPSSGLGYHPKSSGQKSNFRSSTSDFSFFHPSRDLAELINTASGRSLTKPAHPALLKYSIRKSQHTTNNQH